MTSSYFRIGWLVLVGIAANAALAADGPAPIEKVEIGANRELRVNGKPMFPIMAWLQGAEKFDTVKECGMNTVAGYWPGSSDTKDAAQFLQLLDKAGLYGVMPFEPGLKGRPNLLGYIHDDEPDLPHQVSDAEVVPAPSLKVNSGTPLWKLVDGVTHSWSVLDPLAGASVTIRPKKPVTVEKLAVWLTVSPGLAVAKEVAFSTEGKEILRATLEAKKGRQEFPLAAPVTLSELTLAVLSTYPDKNEWGSISEVEGLDSSGENVLAAPPRFEPRAEPAATMERYRSMKAADPSRPVFLTLTGHFHPHFRQWTDDQQTQLYPQYIEASDVVGYDIYPIYGWNKPEWIYLVHDATKLLTSLGGRRPVYAWIETSRGGQWTGELERQKEVKPEHIRAEVWMAVCGGATSIGYFTHIWKPSFDSFGAPEENRKALRQVNDQLTRLAPAILAPPAKATVSIGAAGDAKLAVLAKEHDGRLWLFAVNYDERLPRAEVVVSVEGLKAGATVTVVDENRTIPAGDGSFADVFEPLAVHIYQVDKN
ncbi:MAG: hypothetical protein ACYC6Y_23960 [Thermoguttaceae bacterium]